MITCRTLRCQVAFPCVFPISEIISKIQLQPAHSCPDLDLQVTGGEPEAPRSPLCIPPVHFNEEGVALLTSLTSSGFSSSSCPFRSDSLHHTDGQSPPGNYHTFYSPIASVSRGGLQPICSPFSAVREPSHYPPPRYILSYVHWQNQQDTECVLHAAGYRWRMERSSGLHAAGASAVQPEPRVLACGASGPSADRENERGACPPRALPGH